MARIRQLLMGSPSRLFLSTRGFTSGLALVLALYYTKLLGVEKRSILVFIMVTALILTVIFTSGVSLTFRNRAAESINSKNLMAYLVTIAFGGLGVAILSTVLLSFFSQSKSEIPPSIYLIGFVYSFLACVNLGFQDALVAKGNLKLATFLDFVTILIQGLSLIFFVYLDQTSLFMSVIISFVISYLLIVFATISVFIQTEKLDFVGVNSEIKALLKSSKQNQLFGIANGMADRLDRFLIGLMLPLSFLAKYALITSLISFTRFFPEAYNRVLLLKHHQNTAKQKSNIGLIAYVMIGISVVAFVFASQGFIQIVFGQKWLLPLNVALLFALQEILRGWYQSKATKLVALGGSKTVSQMSLFLIVGALVLMLIGINLVGLVGAPLSTVILYAVLNQVISHKLKVLN
jgi:O-antigen/teichoic acid export membrane protein